MTGNILLPGARERPWSPGDDFEKNSAGLWVPPSAVPEPKYLAVGLFCGAGGMDLGLTYAGFHVIAASDGWIDAAITYLLNLGGPDTKVHLVGDELPEGRKPELRWFREHSGETITAVEFFDATRRSAKADPDSMPGGGWISSDEGREHNALPCEHFYLGDAAALTGVRILEDLGVESDDISLVAGGPPCQGFSRAGKREADDPRNELVFEFMRIVTEVHPRAFVMENVPGIVDMVTKEGIPVLDALALQAEEGGMGTFEGIRRALAETAGVGAALRSPPRPKRAGKNGDEEAEEDDQGSLF